MKADALPKKASTVITDLSEKFVHAHCNTASSAALWQTKQCYHHLMALWNDKAPPSFSHLAQKPEGAASGAGSDWYCNVLDIASSRVHLSSLMDVLSAVIMGWLCQTYQGGLKNRIFALLAPHGETASSSKMASNCAPAVLSQSQDPVSSFPPIWHCKVAKMTDNGDLSTPSHLLQIRAHS